MQRTLIAALLAGLFTTAHAGPTPKKVWITVGDQAFGQLQKLVPSVVAADSSHVPNGMMMADGVSSQDQVHVVEVDESVLHGLSDSIHDELHRCGGFVAHTSRQEAVRALQPANPANFTRPTYAIDNQSIVKPLLPQMQESKIGSTIVDLSKFTNRYYTTQAGVAASDWLSKQWQSLASGRSDVTVEQIAHAGWPQKSVMLTIKGQSKPEEIVVVGGHLDSIHGGTQMTETTLAPGADDDASGIASMTEAIRVMLANGYKPNRTIKFIGYSAEEVGLRGSKDIAQRFKSQNANVVGVIQLDMTNYKGSDKDIYIYTDYTDNAQNEFVANLIKTYLPELSIGYDRCGYGCSDHASWNAQGYPTSMPFEASFNSMNKKIHTAQDTFASMGNQAQHALKFSKLALSFAVELGSDGAVPPQPGGDKSEKFEGSLSQDQNKQFGPFKLAAGARLVAELNGVGDADLYLRQGAAPSRQDWDCRPYRGDAVETCSLTATSATDVYLMVDAYRDNTYSLKVSYPNGLRAR
ncbi:M28 family metallopeptidase [Parachitinimonas caeni]|uniref:M28 family metallopeptidase n=1 Tax=Parachitinimonas caeni TaxID=3031301 RepID=A0ABT7E0N5_9NEIS|nr:M28 family metallopeptidase [Parachitinimonas caeni]MDK2125866.1 M28 family metallopeptidase [Parachitinimonas caeni]